MDFVTAPYKLCELVPASEAKEMADKAVFILEQQSVAYAINSAAKTGEHEVTWSKTLSDEMVALLESEEYGYKVKKNLRAADPDKSWTISGF